MTEVVAGVSFAVVVLALVVRAVVTETVPVWREHARRRRTVRTLDVVLTLGALALAAGLIEVVVTSLAPL